MKKSSRLVGLFATTMVAAPLAGCSDAPDDVDVCYDENYDNYCDHDGDRIDRDNYLVIDGKKTRIFIQDDIYYEGFGDDDGGSYGG